MEHDACRIYNTKSDDCLPSDFMRDNHVHILCRQGVMRFADGRRMFQSETGDLVIWQMSNTIQEVSYSEDFEAEVLVVSGNFLSRFNPEMTWATQGFVFIRLNPSFHLTNDDFRLIENDFHMLRHRQNADGRMFQADIMGRLFQIFLFDLWNIYSTSIAQMQANDNSSQIFLRFAMLVQQHCRKHRDVAFYADLLCITPKYLSQVSKKVTNIPASEWISYYTMTELISMLNDLDKTLAEIANEMNFSTQSFFSRYVKNMLGMSPTEYRSKEHYFS